MNILFVHNNFPGQFVHLAPALRARGHKVVAIADKVAPGLPGIPMGAYQVRHYRPGELRHTHRFQMHVERGLAAAAVARKLAEDGFSPDLIFGHVGWGETLFLKDVWPNARMALYAEFYYAGRGLDVGFDASLNESSDETAMLVRARNASFALGMAHADYALAPTEFQRSVFPACFRERIVVQHDGVDCASMGPRSDASFALEGGRKLTSADEVITYVNRHLEPMRGIHIMLRALPRVLDARPEAEVIIIGADSGRQYGAPPPQGKTWKQVFLDEIGDRLDKNRVHFVGSLPRERFLDALAVSSAHAYLTFPFPLSWSLVDAMAMECAIIASKTPPVAEAIRHGENGVLVDFFDHDAWSEALITALEAPERMAPLRRQARADAKARYDLKSVCLPRLVALVEGWARG
ncbi:MAG TPA: glycosyltransferase [Caulobacterales bacterium]|nr:glycosyltransferase [Caulobacterales bacterium]